MRDVGSWMSLLRSSQSIPWMLFAKPVPSATIMLPKSSGGLRATHGKMFWKDGYLLPPLTMLRSKFTFGRRSHADRLRTELLICDSQDANTDFDKMSCRNGLGSCDLGWVENARVCFRRICQQGFLNFSFGCSVDFSILRRKSSVSPFMVLWKYASFPSWIHP